jgi:hypothetical protein
MMLRTYLVPSNLIWVMSLWVSSYQIGKKLLILLCFWWFFYTICISGSLLLSRSGWCLPLMRNEELGVTRLCQKDWNVLSFCLLGVLFSAHCCLGECFVFHFAFVCTSSSTYEIIFIYHQEELLLCLAFMVSDFFWLFRKYLPVGLTRQIISRGFIRGLGYPLTPCFFLMMRIGTFNR